MMVGIVLSIVKVIPVDVFPALSTPVTVRVPSVVKSNDEPAVNVQLTLNHEKYTSVHISVIFPL